MKSREINLWLDERWYAALSHLLDSQTVEDKLQDYLDQLLLQLPPDQYAKISAEIQEEDEAAQRQWEEERQFSTFHIKERGADIYFRCDKSMNDLNTAISLRRYLRQEGGGKVDSFVDLFPNRQEISAGEFDQMTQLSMENPQKVTGVFDLDFDKQEFSTVHPVGGWRSYGMKDISTAAYHAFRNGNSSYEQRVKRFQSCLSGKEISSAGHLSSRGISFSDGIVEMEDQLNFYLEASYELKAALGDLIRLDVPDDWINLYVNYGCAAGQICDALSVELHHADGRQEELTYPLNAAEKAVLLREMDSYCQQETGQTLKEYAAQVLAEDMAPPTAPSM